MIINEPEDITSRMLRKYKLPDDIEALIFESISGYFVSHITQFLNLTNTFDNLDKALNLHSTCEKVLITGDFNAQEGEISMS